MWYLSLSSQLPWRLKLSEGFFLFLAAAVWRDSFEEMQAEYLTVITAAPPKVRMFHTLTPRYAGTLPPSPPGAPFRRLLEECIYNVSIIIKSLRWSSPVTMIIYITISWLWDFKLSFIPPQKASSGMKQVRSRCPNSSVLFKFVYFKGSFWNTSWQFCWTFVCNSVHTRWCVEIMLHK